MGKMKYIVSFCAVGLCALLPMVHADAKEVKVSDGTALQNAQITIPAEYKGKTVTTIMEHGFENCSSLESITIPDSIVSIQDYAFKGCTKLNISTLPSNLVSIGRHAFYGCIDITEITIPATTNFIGAYAFYKTSLSSAIFKDANNWVAGSDGFSYIRISKALNNENISVYTYALTTPSAAAKALIQPVSVIMYSVRQGTSGTYEYTYQDKCWYSQDWTKPE